ncbi:folate family ECF transporter S component [Anaerococcus sp. AGMB00486]|uniref:Folate family ECF transporter S component n=2 Tax=Anaerococcus TaxID=165779 RepID=A0ABX2N8W5_9FIRM|nr:MULTISPECIES: folate family ECF transporter S component [Anaerococcus]MSS77455.1 folate family ECF transporter S component [Anaerococcus porci]NVF11115.1 folate family ECF transporter S component [Anaerococcus faecalis]
MKNLKNIRTMILLSFFIALSVVVSKFFSITTMSQKVGLGFIVTALMCSIFNPSLAVIASIIIDLVANLLFPTPGGFYLPFVITKIASALIYTFFLYRKEITRKNIICATTLNTLITSLFLNTIWVSQLTGNPFISQFLLRIPSMAFNYVLHTIVLVIILPKLAHLLRKEVKRLGAQPENAPY